MAASCCRLMSRCQTTFYLRNRILPTTISACNNVLINRTTIKCYCDESKKLVKTLDLAKPQPKKKVKGFEKNTKASVQEKEVAGLEEDIVKAAKEVAQSFGGNAKKVESDLLNQLRSHAEITESQKDGKLPPTLNELLGGMKVQVSRSVPRRGRTSNVKQESETVGLGEPQSIVMQEKRRYEKIMYQNVELLEGPALGVYTNSEGQPKMILQVPVQPSTSFYDKLEQEEFQKQLQFPASNAFEEMSRWTKQGKLWTFPINNEQGMEEEAKVGFHEHVFLHQHMNDFPKKGPVHIFMELVLVGLSKNPFLTVHQKLAHINWFKNYFDQHKQLLDEIIKEDPEKEEQSQL